jgi:WD40 repeat protein
MPGKEHTMKHLLIFLLILLPATTTLAGEPPTAPMLRLETGFHTAVIKRIAADAQGRWLATASEDKTLRLWDIQDAKHPGLLRTFRLPGGAGNEGKLYAAAMDPAGEWIAAGGWDWDDSIYILDRATGQMRRRIEGLGNVINHLCVSPDGRWLAAVLGAGEGLRVYDAGQGFRQVFSDRDYGSRSYGCAFSPDSRSLVSTCYDGRLRLYRVDGKSFRKDRQTVSQGGKQPFAVAFHPAGDRIAVGFKDSTAVSVVDANKLTQLYAADTSGLDNGNLNSVAWSADGSFLFAGGMYDDGSDNRPVLRWADKGRGQRTSWQAAGDTVMELKPLPDGSLLVGTGDPALLRYDRQGGKLFDLRPDLPDMHNKQGDSFQLSKDGRLVSFGLGFGGEELGCFDLSQRQVRKGECQGSLTAPITAAAGLKIEGWKNTTSPTLNGEPLALEDYETAFSTAIAPDSRHFLLGTHFWLRCFDRQGKERWQQPVPGAAWGVNISKDGRLAVAAFGDGTVRWFRLSDGEPLLSLFVTKDASQWIAWTPSGWYDSSPGGDSLIGWQVNNGKDRLADFFPASQFRERFYRPDVVTAVLETLDEGRAVARADAAQGRSSRQVTTPLQYAQPPVIELLAPADNSSFRSPTLTLRYRVRTHGGPPITALQVMVDNRPRHRATVERRRDAEWEGSLDVTLPAKDMTLSLLADNGQAVSTDKTSTIRLRWLGGKDALKPVLYLLAVGVDDYDAPAINFVVDDKGKRTNKRYLQYASADARAFVTLMKQQAGPGKLYREVKTRLRTNEQADQDAVLQGLEWIDQQTTPNDVAMVFLAGHGKLDSHGDYYFLPRDFTPWRYTSSAVSYDAIRRTVARLRGKALFFVDTCYSGKAAGMRGNGTVDITKIINDLSAAENGVVVLSATTGNQTAQERDAWQHGAFTLALLEALHGDADYVKDKAVRLSEINTYLAHRVPELTGHQQTPAVVIPENVPDFPVVSLP